MTARPVVSLSRQIHSSAARRSQVGKVPIPIPPSVALTLPASSVPPHVHPSSPEAHRVFTVSGPLGSTTLPISPSIILTPPTPSSSSLTISVHDPAVKTQRSLWGLTRTLISNAITGVSAGFNLEVKLVGVGYRAAIEPIPQVFMDLAKQTSSLPTDALPRERLNIKLGFAHPVLIDIPPQIKVTVPETTKIVLSGTDKQKLGQFAATIRQWRKPEPYRGKVSLLIVYVADLTGYLCGRRNHPTQRGQEKVVFTYACTFTSIAWFPSLSKTPPSIGRLYRLDRYIPIVLAITEKYRNSRHRLLDLYPSTRIL